MQRSQLTTALAALLLPVTLTAVPGNAVAQPAAGPTPQLADGSVGSWSVTATGADTWRLAWTAPQPLSVGGDHPRILTSEDTAIGPAGTDLGLTTLAADGRTVGVVVTSATEPRPETFDVTLSGRTLDEPSGSGHAGGSGDLAAPERTLLPGDPGDPGDVPVVSEDYTLDPVEVEGMPTPIEMKGHVVKPTDSAAGSDDPLVLILHGKHGSCFVGERFPTYSWPCTGRQRPVPNHRGYHYLQEVLASHGYVTVSISANAISAQDVVPDFGTAARARLVQAHLDQWAAWDETGQETVDLTNVVLVGHSRGGEGVARASMEIPLDAAYRVTGQVLVAPTDFGHQTSPYVPTVTLLPYCDGDVFWLGGQHYTDRSRDLTSEDTSMKSSVLVMGANHNFFNTEWIPGMSKALSEDDFRETGSGACEAGAPTRLTATEQLDVGTAYVAGAVRLFAGAEDEFLPMYDGSATRVGSTGDAVVLSHMLGGGRTVRRPGIDATPTDGATAAIGLCVGSTPWDNAGDLCGRYAQDYAITPHWPGADDNLPLVQALQVRWTAAGQSGGLSLTEPLDLTGAAGLDLRTIVDPRIGDVELEVRVTDAAGESDQVAAVTGTTLEALPRQAESGGRYWAQTLRVDPADLEGVDVERVSSIELVGLSDTGRVWLLDASAVPQTLPVVPDKRMPFVDLGKAIVKEGPRGTHVAEVPFDVIGALEAEAQLRVYEEASEHVERAGLSIGDSHLVTIPAGATDGTFEVEYAGNQQDSVTPRVVVLVGHGLREVLTRDYHGELAIEDDDPSPRLGFRSSADVVDEGGTSRWVVRLVGSSRRGLMVGLRPVAGEGSPVTASDLPGPWLRQIIELPSGTDHALQDTNMTLWDFVSDRDPRAVFEVPIRDDAAREPAETLTFRAVTNTGWRSRPITVTIPRGR